MRRFSEVLRELREEKKLTQRQLANSLSLSDSAIGMYESGKREPNYETLEIIADYFNVDMNFLLGKTLVKNTYLFDSELMQAMALIIKTKRLKLGLTLEEIISKLEGITLEELINFEENGSALPIQLIESLSNILELNYFNDVFQQARANIAFADVNIQNENEVSKASIDPRFNDFKFALMHGENDLTEEQKQDLLDYYEFIKSKKR
ncbi:MAG: helix-turn-helix domain-containing protein [Anaerorhabdus sp.]|uniref:helix-turn-helix domain-containing protein n=1 Tax=Anaerorhabdus sp. TaxID=1872524 RepID=UPI003A8B1EB9